VTATVAALLPPLVLLQVHHISLFHAASRDLITQSHHQKVVAWLSCFTDHPVSPAAAAAAGAPHQPVPCGQP
jgi:hypothetical protein